MNKLLFEIVFVVYSIFGITTEEVVEPVICEVVEEVDLNYEEITTYIPVSYEEIFNKKCEEIFAIEDKKEKIIQYNRLLHEYKNKIEIPTMFEDVFTNDELLLIARCVETEVYQREFTCRTNIAAVIFNRLNDSRFGNTVDTVVIPGQVAFGRKEVTDDSLWAVKYAWYFGSDCEDALWFHSFKEPIEFYGTYMGYSDSAVHHFYH